MKRFVTLMMSLLLTAGLLTACGGQKDEGGAEDAQVSLNSLYAGWAEEYHWSEDAASGDNTAVKGRKANDGNPGDCEKGYVWLRLNMGYKNRVIPRDIISIMKACGIGKKAVGKIEIFNEFLYVALKESVADYAKSQLNGATYDRRRLSASLLR